MNVFHWHIVDSQSFPFQSASIEHLSSSGIRNIISSCEKKSKNIYKFLDPINRGAFSSNHIYKIDEITDLVEFARLRGVRIIPEFDTPSHTLSWRGAGDDVLTDCDKPGGTMDITNEKNFDLIENLFEEIKSIFKGAHS